MGDICPLCQKPMDQHSVLKKVVRGKGLRKAEQPIGWLCPDKESLHGR